MSEALIRTYIINFLAQHEGFENQYRILQNFLLFSEDVLGYWNYIPLVYCVKSRLTSTELRMRMVHIFAPANFLIAEVNPMNMDGLLPKEAWEWFYSPPQKYPTLGQLLQPKVPSS